MKIINIKWPTLVSGWDRVGGERGAVDPLPVMPIGQLS